MLNVPEEVKTLFQTDGIHKNFHVHFPNGETTDLNNENFITESVKFTESLCSQQYFKFGLAEASQIEFTAVGIPNILGAVIDCAIEIDCTSLGSAWAEQNPIDTALAFLEPQTCEYNSKIYYRIPYGRFIVDSCPRNHGAMAQRKITAFSEKMFSGEQFIVGQYPVANLVLDPLQVINASKLTNDEMNLVTLSLPTYSYVGLAPRGGTSNGVNWLNSVHGISYMTSTTDGRGTSPAIIFQVPKNDKTPFYAVRAEYTEHEFDKYSQELFDKIVAVLPSGDYTYDTDSNYNKKVFSSTENALFAGIHGLSPCIYVREIYMDASNNTIYRYSRPIFISSGKTYVINIESSFDYYINDIPSGYTQFGDSVVFFCLIGKWFSVLPSQSSPYLSVAVSSGTDNRTITDWSTTAPFDGREVVERSGNAYVYWKQLDNTDMPKISVENTLTFTKCTGSGNYYTYSNAVSTLKIVEGLMEITGEFWKIYRTGINDFFKLSDNQTLIPVSRSDWEEFWWDENNVEPIGTVGVKMLSDGSEEKTEQIIQYSIGNGESIYLMEDNAILSRTTATAAEIQTLLNNYFAPNASVINFTPVDLTMRGLPYLEVGDYIQLTAEDGTIINTYILQQTFSGIQRITTDVSSINGELLEVIEDE